MKGDDIAGRLLRFTVEVIHWRRQSLAESATGFLVREGNELTAILKASAKTAKARAG